MFALLVIQALSEIRPIYGCETDNTITVGPTEMVTEHIYADSSLCIDGSVFIQSDEPYHVIYRFDVERNGQTTIGREVHAENPILIGSIARKTKIKIIPIQNRPMRISLIGVYVSHSVNSKNFYGVFSTMKNFSKKTTIDPDHTVTIVAVNEYPLKFTIKKDKSLTRVLVNGYESSSSGNRIGVVATSNDRSNEVVEIKCQNDEEPTPGFRNPFGEDFSTFFLKKVPMFLAKLSHIQIIIRIFSPIFS